MLQRESLAVGYCLNRVVEASHLAALATDQGNKESYLKLAESWLKLVNNAEFTEKLEAHFTAEKLK
jgi:hypothetical protein